MDQFAELFSKLQTPEAMSDAHAQATRSFLKDLATQSQYITALPPDPKRAKGGPNWDATKTRYPAPKTLQCANVQPAKYSVCQNPGKLACSACRLVSYCSKVSVACVDVARVLLYEHTCRNVRARTGVGIKLVSGLRPPL